MPAVRTILLDRSWTAIPGSPLQSSTYSAPSGSGIVTTYFNATTGGTYQAFYINHLGQEVELTAPVVVLANQLIRDVFNGNVPQMFSRFTPSAINGRASVEVSVSAR